MILAVPSPAQLIICRVGVVDEPVLGLLVYETAPRGEALSTTTCAATLEYDYSRAGSDNGNSREREFPGTLGNSRVRFFTPGERDLGKQAKPGSYRLTVDAVRGAPWSRRMSYVSGRERRAPATHPRVVARLVGASPCAGNTQLHTTL